MDRRTKLVTFAIYNLIRKSSLVPRLSLLSGESLGMRLDFHCIVVTIVSLTGAVTHMGDGGATDLHTRGSQLIVTQGIITALNAVYHTSNPCRIIIVLCTCPSVPVLPFCTKINCKIHDCEFQLSLKTELYTESISPTL